MNKNINNNPMIQKKMIWKKEKTEKKDLSKEYIELEKEFEKNKKLKENILKGLPIEEEILSDDFTFINYYKKSLRMIGYAKIFKLTYEKKNDLSNLNRWLKNFSEEEMESICMISYEYSSHYKNNWGHLNYLKAIRFLTNIQAGLTKFDSFIDTHRQNVLVEKYVNTNDKEEKKNLRQKIMTLVATYSNQKMMIYLAQILDAPIQISYQGYKHQMVEVLRDIAVNGKSERERTNAANSLLQHLNPNQMSSLQINIGVSDKKEVSFIDQAQQALKLLANKKLEDIEDGSNIKDVIDVDIIQSSKVLEKEEIEKEEIEDISEEEKELMTKIKENNGGKQDV